MSGDIVGLSGRAVDEFIAALSTLEERGPVLIGGLAVMCRVGGQHRPTLDIDSAFNNESDIPTTIQLVADGLAEPNDEVHRVIVGESRVDVIDTSPIDPVELPDDPGSRLFVCAHRFAFETATPMRIVGDAARTTVRVATVEALISMKAHALCFGRKQRRETKRASDLYDLVRLAAVDDAPVLVDAPWALRRQVREAIGADLEDLASAGAVLRESTVVELRAITESVLELVTRELDARLA